VGILYYFDPQWWPNPLNTAIFLVMFYTSIKTAYDGFKEDDERLIILAIFFLLLSLFFNEFRFRG